MDDGFDEWEQAQKQKTLSSSNQTEKSCSSEELSSSSFSVILSSDSHEKSSSSTEKKNSSSSNNKASSSSAKSSSSNKVSSSSEQKNKSSSSVKTTSSSSKNTSSSPFTKSSSSSAKAVSSSSKKNEVSSSSENVKLSSSGKASWAYLNPAISYGEIVDERDGQVYKTVKIGEQTWMAENLNFEVANSYCYENKSDSCFKYGRLYAWSAAMDSAGLFSSNGINCGNKRTCKPNYPVRGACPKDWHLPDTTEWKILFTAVGGQESACHVLKSIIGWTDDEGNISSTDAYGFSALPAGLGQTDYWWSIGYTELFWSATESNVKSDPTLTGAHDINLYYTYDGAVLAENSKSMLLSIRCLKN